MGDDEILKRVAEIEDRLEGEEGINKDWFITGGALHRNVNLGPIRQTHWSPLRQPADWGPLIEKYHVDCVAEVDADGCDFWECVATGGFTPKRCTHESLPHAILLAIIEAHNG